MNKNERVQAYMQAMLRNPEWMKSVARRYGNGEDASMVDIASAIVNLENALVEKVKPLFLSWHQFCTLQTLCQTLILT